jgi:hypothetical protein
VHLHSTALAHLLTAVHLRYVLQGKMPELHLKPLMAARSPGAPLLRLLLV